MIVSPPSYTTMFVIFQILLVPRLIDKIKESCHTKTWLNASAKSVDTCQPAQCVQVDLSGNILFWVNFQKTVPSHYPFTRRHNFTRVQIESICSRQIKGGPKDVG